MVAEYDIAVHSGRLFCPVTCTPEDIDPLDIAYGLARISRFSGGAIKSDIDRYTVAHHCLIMHVVICDQYGGTRPDLELEALVHDACEALTGFGDIVRPAKVGMSDMCYVEDMVDMVVRQKYGINLTKSEAIREADRRLVMTEFRDLTNFVENEEALARGWVFKDKPYDFNITKRFADWLALSSKDLAYLYFHATERAAAKYERARDA